MARSILITGGAGFIGSHLAQALVKQGHNVRVIDHFSTSAHIHDPKALSSLPSDVEVVYGDVRSLLDVTRALRGIEVVYHLASFTGHPQGLLGVRTCIENNSLATATLLQAIADSPIQRLILGSSMRIYGEGLYADKQGNMYASVHRNTTQLNDRLWDPLDQDGRALDPLPTPETKAPDLRSIYALSKFDQERLCRLIGDEIGIDTLALRFFNVYGPGQPLNSAYSETLTTATFSILNNQTPILWEDGHQSSDYVHIVDAVEACLLALDADAGPDRIFNVGSGTCHTHKEIVSLLADALGRSGLEPRSSGRSEKGRIRHCYADVRLAARGLGYRPRIPLKDGIKEFADWISRFSHFKFDGRPLEN